MSNLEIYTALSKPPKDALKTIGAGRLKGFTDINPQWRYKAMTEQFGPCGQGWRFTVDRLWTEPAADGEVFAFAQISLSVNFTREGQCIWSDPIPGIGGSKAISKEKAGLYSSDEAYKMAVTDALGTAMKMLGVAADIYSGRWDGSKYRDEAPPAKSGLTPSSAPSDSPTGEPSSSELTSKVLAALKVAYQLKLFDESTAEIRRIYDKATGMEGKFSEADLLKIKQEASRLIGERVYSALKVCSTMQDTAKAMSGVGHIHAKSLSMENILVQEELAKITTEINKVSTSIDQRNQGV